jgi:hypothetical protein
MEWKKKRKIWIRSRERREDLDSELKKRRVREEFVFGAQGKIRSGSSRVEDSLGGIFVVGEKEKEKEYSCRKGSIRGKKKDSE